MATSISNGESGLSVRTKLNDIWHSLDLNEYNKDISDTAVDVFVYDTSKDSDGGAWRKRTQHTSWYNETLNTATRGSRKEFPAVAVIVLDSANDTLTIYDGDDPDLPMWMVFNISNGSFTSGSVTKAVHGTTMTSIAMLNGVLCCTVAAAGYGLGYINFLSEKVWQARNNATFVRQCADDLSLRNTGFNCSDTDEFNIASESANDVAMTVLPNAPIDTATGLPVPTIAVATGGGVSVITDSGAVYDSDSTTGMKDVAFDEDNTLYYMRQSSAYLLLMAEPSEYTAGDGFGTGIASTSIGGQEFNLISARSQVTTAFGKSFVASGGNSSTALPRLLGLYAVDKTNLTNTMAAGIHYEYNTGWMNGDIKLATLSDTDDTDVTGSELVTNGTFDSDVSGWTAGNAVVSWDASGYLVVDDTANAGSDSRAYQDITTVVGETYVLSFDKISTTSAFWFGIGSASNIGSVYYSGSLGTSTGPHSKTFVATETTTRISMISSGAGVTKYDNVSVRLAEEDRSVNGNGLQVFGTVTKNPVATGADLVGYGSFGTGSYLKQPYNSDLDFGTGDFCIMGWCTPEGSGSRYILDGRNSESSSDGFILYRASNGGFQLTTYDAGAGTGVLTNTQAYLNSTRWTFVTALRRNGILEIYVNGKLDNTNNSTVRNVDGSERKTTFGISVPLHSYHVWPGSLALWRISATAPSAAQIAKIYEDEKVLFQENAKATLYGSSDAVTALAYDDTTELLHVGTSGGRSVFQGLRRVDNTTDAVGAAISASNGLVAED